MRLPLCDWFIRWISGTLEKKRRRIVLQRLANRYRIESSLPLQLIALFPGHLAWCFQPRVTEEPDELSIWLAKWKENQTRVYDYSHSKSASSKPTCLFGQAVVTSSRFPFRISSFYEFHVLDHSYLSAYLLI